MYTYDRIFYYARSGMKQKKALLINVLTKIKPYRNLAEGFLVLVEQTEDISFIEVLLSLIKRQMSTIKNEQTKQRVINEIHKIKKIKYDETQINKKDKEDADKILDFLLNEKE